MPGLNIILITLKQMCMCKQAAFQLIYHLTHSSYPKQLNPVHMMGQVWDFSTLQTKPCNFCISSRETTDPPPTHSQYQSPIKDFLPTGNPKTCSGLGRANRNLRVS